MQVTIELKKDQVLMNEGDPSDLLYLLHSGELAVYKYDKVSKSHNVIGYIEPGEMVGEMSFLDNLPRSATIKAKTDCILRVMNRRDFEKILSTQDPFVHNLVLTLSGRLRKANKKIHL